MNNIPLYDTETRRWWNRIRTTLGGTVGLAIIPVWSWDTAPYATGIFQGDVLTTHSDGSTFSDGSRYSQGSIRITSVADTPIGATSIHLRIELADADISGVRFSFRHALYETGAAEAPVNGVYNVPIFPSVRAPIPAGSYLNFDLPTCLVHLKEDRGMDVSNNGYMNQRSITWVEATEYWSDLASGVIS